jgi:Fe-S-cluster containining protein
MSLCFDCGLCCDGTLFSHAPSEGGGPHAAALPPAEGKPGCFQQPCVAYGTGGCSIYEERPTACRTFDCTVLTAFQQERITRDEALEAINELKSRRARVAELLGEPDSGAAMTKARALAADGELSEELRIALGRFSRGAMLFYSKL